MSHAALKNLEATIALDGKLRNPKLKLRSNLGPALERGLNVAFQQELTARQEQLLAKAHHELDQHVARFEQQLARRQGEVLQKLQIGDAQLAELKQMASQIGLPADLQGGKNALLDGFMRKAGLR